MAGKRIAGEALAMVAEVETRLLAMGIPPERMPERRLIFESCWPLARRLVKMRKRSAQVRAYADYCDAAVAEVEQSSGEHVEIVARFWRDVAGQELRRLVDFRPAEWHLALSRCPASGAELRREAA